MDIEVANAFDELIEIIKEDMYARGRCSYDARRVIMTAKLKEFKERYIGDL